MLPAHGEDRDPVELLADQFVEQHRRGTNPSIADYAARYPDFAQEIRELFPAVLAMERLKAHCEPPSAGRASLGVASLERLGEFRLLREIGRGGMGVVYEALHESLGRHVAVKVLPQQGAKQYRAFQREARTAGRLHHNNIVPLFGVGEQDGFHYIVMQLIRGVDLEAILATLRHQEDADADPSRADRASESVDTHWKIRTRYKQDAMRLADSLVEGTCIPASQAKSGRGSKTPAGIHSSDGAATGDLPAEENRPDVPTTLGPTYWRQVAAIAGQAAEALFYAHSHGTLHRDVKPANLILDSQGVVWITDFGLARAMDEEHASQTSLLAGTLRYMAPEQFSDQQCDKRSDIYSLGLTIYEMLTLEPAFSDSSRSALIQKITRESPRRPSEVRPGIPRDLEAIVMKAIARDPSARYASSDELANDLRRYLEDRPILARPMSLLETAWRWTRRNRMVAALGTAAVAFLLTTAIFATLEAAQRTQVLQMETQLRTQAETQRVRAEANLRLAAEAFEDVFRQVTGGMLPGFSVDALDEQSPDPAFSPGVGKREETILVELLDFYDQFARQNDDDLRWQYETARAFRRACEIQLRLGHDQDAELAGQRALAIYQRLAESEPNNSEYLAGVAATGNLLASIAWETGRSDIAFRESRRVWQYLASHSEAAAKDTFCQIELARAYNRYAITLSLLASPRGSRIGTGDRRTDAKEYLERSLAIVDNLLQESPESVEYGLTIAESYRYLWGLNIRRKQIPAATANRENAIQVLEALAAKHADEPECQFMLAEVYLLPFRFSTNEVDTAESSRQTLRAVEIASQLVEQFPQVPKHRSVLAMSLWAAAQVSERNNELLESRQQLDHAIRIQQALVQENPTRQRHQSDLVRFMNDRVRQTQSMGPGTERRTALQELIQAIESFSPGSRAPSPFLRTQAKAYTDLAKVLREQGDDAAAAAAESKARELTKQISRPPLRPFGSRAPKTAAVETSPNGRS